MSPIELKLKGNETLAFSKLNQEEISKTWRVCTKVKDSLENGSRLENLSWRLWFIHHIVDENKKIEKEINERIEVEDVLNNNNFKLNQFSSDQIDNQIIELKDIFPIDYTDEFIIDYDPSFMYSSFDNMTTTENESSCVTKETNFQFNSQPQSNYMNLSFDPYTTLQSKLLSTLPKETLNSAERLLLSSNENKNQDSTFYHTFQLNPSLTKNNQELNSYICSHCNTTTTPLWRRSNDKILCNACGLYLKLHNVPRPKHLIPFQDNSKSNKLNKIKKLDIICSNCNTSTTPLWRRDNEGLPLCNACGLYLKLHCENRPLSMKTDIIKKRQRTESLFTNEELKKPKYFDHHTLYSNLKGKNTSKSVTNSLPGTGILMMSNNKK